ncbi:hypothetical protein ACVOMV_20585 [Mesorhizobium atlanticum]
MRRWKIALGAAVAIGAVSVASVHLLNLGYLGGGTAGAAPRRRPSSCRCR